jgi:hypothetical protein
MGCCSRRRGSSPDHPAKQASIALTAFRVISE